MQRIEDVKKGLACHALCRNDHLPCSDCAYHGPGLPPCGKEVHEDAIAMLEQLEAQVPKWISVDERLPEDDVEVLVYAISNNENSCVAMTSYTHHMHGYNIEGWRSPWQYFFYERKITHWMPLPEAPKEDDHAQTD